MLNPVMQDEEILTGNALILILVSFRGLCVIITDVMDASQSTLRKTCDQQMVGP